MEEFKKDFLERISKIKTFDAWDKRIIELAFENALLDCEIKKSQNLTLKK